MSQVPLLYPAPSFYNVLQDNGFQEYNIDPKYNIANTTCSLKRVDTFANVLRTNSKQITSSCETWFYSKNGTAPNTQISVKIYNNRISISHKHETLCIANYLFFAKTEENKYIFEEPYSTDGAKLVYKKQDSHDRSYLNNIWFLETEGCGNCFKQCSNGGKPKPSKSTYKCTEKTIVYKKKERRIWVKDDKSYIKRMQTKNGKRQAIYTRV